MKRAQIDVTHSDQTLWQNSGQRILITVVSDAPLPLLEAVVRTSLGFKLTVSHHLRQTQKNLRVPEQQPQGFNCKSCVLYCSLTVVIESCRCLNQKVIVVV